MVVLQVFLHTLQRKLSQAELLSALNLVRAISPLHCFLQSQRSSSAPGLSILFSRILLPDIALARTDEVTSLYWKPLSTAALFIYYFPPSYENLFLSNKRLNKNKCQNHSSLLFIRTKSYINIEDTNIIGFSLLTLRKLLIEKLSQRIWFFELT